MFWFYHSIIFESKFLSAFWKKHYNDTCAFSEICVAGIQLLECQYHFDEDMNFCYQNLVRGKWCKRFLYPCNAHQWSNSAPSLHQSNCICACNTALSASMSVHANHCTWIVIFCLLFSDKWKRLIQRGTWWSSWPRFSCYCNPYFYNVVGNAFSKNSNCQWQCWQGKCTHKLSRKRRSECSISKTIFEMVYKAWNKREDDAGSKFLWIPCHSWQAIWHKYSTLILQ